MLALFGDSTNVDRPGFTGPEIDVIDAFEELFTSTQGKLVVALFSSSIYRMQVLVDLAAQFDRKVAFVGRSIVQNAEIAQRLGYLRVPGGMQIRDVDVQNYASQDVLCLATGSQGEPQAALPRIAIDDHRWVRLGPDDTVVLSARAIPGNEKAIARVMSHIARRGADVVTDSMKHVHVSGHGSAEELKLRDLARQASLLRADSRRVPSALATCPDRQARDAGRGAPASGAARRKRRHHPVRRRTAPASPAKRRRDAC